MARRPQTFDELIALAVGFAQAQIVEQIRPEAAIRFGLIQSILFASGRPLPRKISGFRTLTQQAALRNVLGADGQPLQPARQSWHPEGLAFDVDQGSPSIPTFARLWKALGGRSGIDFRSPDPGHFDFPLAGIVPKPAW